MILGVSEGIDYAPFAEELEKLRAKKADERGGFAERILLKEVWKVD